MTTLIQLTTRRYLPDGSPKPHYIATGGRRPVEQADSKQISVSNIIDAIQLAKIAYFEGAPALEVFVQIMGHAPCSSCGYHNAHCRCNKAILAEQIEPFNTLHPEVAAKDARIAELEKQLESYGALLLHVRKALCGDIHNEQDLLGLIAANTARVKVEALHNFAEDYGGGKYGLMNCFDALKQYADHITKEAQ